MNILHLHTEINNTCGISKTIYLITKYSNPQFRHFVICLKGDAIDKFKKNDINIKQLNINNISLINHIKILKIIKLFVKENNIDIIHSHHRYFDFISSFLSPKIKIKKIASVQSIVYKKTNLSYKSEILLAAGKSVKEHLTNYFKIPDYRIIVFNNFIDTTENKISEEKLLLLNRLKIPENSYVIGYAGRFSIEEKGIDILLKAFEIFNNKNKNSYLVMAGEGQTYPEKLKTFKNVILVTANINIFDYYNIFNCVVLPSRVDPFPLVALEAGLMKIPFIGSDVNGISEIISHSKDGLLFKKENVEELVNNMEYFYTHPIESRKIAENLYNKIINNYTVEKSLIKLEDIYIKLMNTA